MHSENVASLGAEEYFHRLKTLVQRHQATCLVVDPFTAFSNAGNPADTQAVAGRLVRWVKSQGITLVCTSLPLPGETGFLGTVLRLATVADTWIYLSFSDSGERNRDLTFSQVPGYQLLQSAARANPFLLRNLNHGPYTQRAETS